MKKITQKEGWRSPQKINRMRKRKIIEKTVVKENYSTSQISYLCGFERTDQMERKNYSQKYSKKFSRFEGHAFLDWKDPFNPSQCVKIHPYQVMTLTFLNTEEYPKSSSKSGEGKITYTVVLSGCDSFLCGFSYSGSTTVWKY